MNEKEAYEKRIKAKLDEMKAHIDKLEASGKEKEAKARQHFYDQLADYHRKIADLEDTSGEAWESLREGADRSLDEISKAFQDAKSAFQK